jgi:hypothetical protein
MDPQDRVSAESYVSSTHILEEQSFFLYLTLQLQGRTRSHELTLVLI